MLLGPNCQTICGLIKARWNLEITSLTAQQCCALPNLYGFVGQRLAIHTGLVEKVAGLSQLEALGWEWLGCPATDGLTGREIDRNCMVK